jgi:hypothetical protein
MGISRGIFICRHGIRLLELVDRGVVSDGYGRWELGFEGMHVCLKRRDESLVGAIERYGVIGCLPGGDAVPIGLNFGVRPAVVENGDIYILLLGQGVCEGRRPGVVSNMH